MPLYIAPLVWDTSGGQPFNYWRMHARARAMFDLRSAAACAIQGGIPGESLVFATGPAPIPSDWELLGEAGNDLLSAAAKVRLGVTANRLAGGLMERLIDSADDTNLIRNHPLWPDKEGRIRWTLGPLDINLAPDRLASWWPTVMRGMKKMVQNAPLAVRRKALHVMLTRNLRIAPTRQNAIDWLDVDDDPESPSTTIRDDFNRGDSATVGSSSEGWSWTEVEGTDFSISGNAMAGAHATQGTARAESSLSSADHYTQVEWTVGTTGISGIAPCTRFDPSANTMYFYLVRPDGSSYLYKYITGSFTQIGTTGAISPSLPDTVRCDVSGTNLTGFFNGVSDRTGSDSSITSNLRTGVYSQVGVTVNVKWDDYIATDGLIGIPIAAYHYNHHLGSMA